MMDAVEHSSANLVGQEFTVETDHKALTFLHSAKHFNSRLARWALRLQTFSPFITDQDKTTAMLIPSQGTGVARGGGARHRP